MGNVSFSTLGAFYDLTQFNNFNDITNIECYSLLDVLLEKFDTRLKKKIDDHNKLINNKN